MLTKVIIAVCLGLCARVGEATNDPDVNEHTVTFSLYTKSTFDSPEKLVLGQNATLADSKFDPLKETVVLIHGYRSTINSTVDQSIKNEILQRNDLNVISVGWDHFTRNPSYPWTASKTRPVGEYVGQFLSFLIDHGSSPSAFHLIGHSLGAHAAGFAGKFLRKYNRTVRRISGLDPAWPNFSEYPEDANRLAKDDADFTDCIHTCGGELGIPYPICQADFYPNGGTCLGQPGCAFYDKPCGHARSYEYFAESINPAHRFEATSCTSNVFGIPIGCRNRGALMGYPASPQFKGLFYLTTRGQYPYAPIVEGN